MRNRIAYALLAALAVATFTVVRHLAMPRPVMAQTTAEELVAIPAADMLGASELYFTNLAADGSLNCPDGIIRARATLKFYDKLQSTWLTPYMAINDTDEDRTQLWATVYSGQATTFLKGVNYTRTFSQNVAMPPGFYTVSVGFRNGQGDVVAADVFLAKVSQ